MTSAVTFQPLLFAQRISSTEPAVDTWQTCSRDPTWPASSTSRAMIASSATAGQPRMPSTPDIVPSFIWASSVRRGSCACWATTPSNALTYSSARRISTASETHFPSSEKTRTRAAESAIAPSSASRSPTEPDGDGPDRTDVDVARGLPEVEHLLDDPGGVGDRVGVGHRVHGGEAAAAPRRANRYATVSESSRPGSRRWVCRSTRPGQCDQPVGVDRDGTGAR